MKQVSYMSVIILGTWNYSYRIHNPQDYKTRIHMFQRHGCDCKV